MIVGVDVSSHQINLAWLENGKPQRWHQELGDAKTPVIDRVRKARIRWHDALAPLEPDEICIEYPYSVNRQTNATLMAVVGAVTASAPRWARVAWPSSGELRAAIGAKNRKVDAHAALELNYGFDLAGFDEHECDALVAAVGWAAILQAQDAA